MSVYSASATLAWKQGGNSVGILFRHGTFLAVRVGLHVGRPPASICLVLEVESTGHSHCLGTVASDRVGRFRNQRRPALDGHRRLPVSTIGHRESGVGGFCGPHARPQPTGVARLQQRGQAHRRLHRLDLRTHPARRLFYGSHARLVCFLMMIIAGVTWKPLAITAGLGAGAGLAVIGWLRPCPGCSRAWALGSPGPRVFGGQGGSDSSQIDFALQAIHQGGLLPHGPGSGMSRNAMPVAYADMIYAFIIEEWGAILGGLRD